MARSTFIRLALFTAIALAGLSAIGCSPQRVLPTLPPPTALPSMTGIASATVLAATTTPVTVPATDTPAIISTLIPTPDIRSPGTPTVKPSATRAPIPTSGTIPIKLFFVAIDDNGKSGKKIGCGDSLVAVNRSIPSTSAPLTAAVKELLGMHDQFYGQSGLYNALYQSRLTVAGISITNAKATINLNGSLTLGGVCDNPRVAAQLQQVALQFSTVKEVAINVNGVSLDKLLSEK